MTWSGHTGLVYCRERTRLVYDSRQYTGPVCPIHVIRALFDSRGYVSIPELIFDSRGYFVFQNFYSSVFNTIVALSV